MDGANCVVIRNTTLGRPSEMAIDFEEERLCWGDTLLKTISCMDFEGSNVVVLPVDNPIPVAIAIMGDHLYYVHQRPYSIRRISKKNGGTGRVIREFAGEERSIFSLKACTHSNQPIPEDSQDHPCHASQCAQLCFAVPNNSSANDAPKLIAQCACRQGFKINPETGNTCQKDNSEQPEPLCTSNATQFQ
ncbi:hypothetical protein TELCIR_22116, partial [Teladorsagia circumcincta]